MLIEAILKNCEEYGNKDAIIDGQSGEHLSYSQLGAAIEKSLAQFQKQHIKRVASIGEPSLSTIPLCLSIGLVHGSWIPLIDSTQLDFVKKNLPGNESLFVIDSPSDSNYAVELDNPETTLHHDAFLITFSSGTTGNAKGVIINQSTKLARTRQAVELFRTGEDDIFLSSSPVHHSLGQRHLFMSLLSGATLVRNVPFTTHDWFNCVAEYKPTFAIPVSTQVKLLENRLSEFKKSLQSFRTLVMSSAPCSSELKQFLRSQNIELWETYGCTETAFAAAVKLGADSQVNHVGAPVSEVDICIDEQTREIKVKTPYLCQGYLAQDALFQSSFDKEGYFKTGDIGAWLGSNIQFHGRIGLEFSVAGKKVNPVVIEDQLIRLEDIEIAVIAPVNNPVFGHTVGVFYQIKRTCRKSAVEVKKAILSWAIANLEKHEVPTHLVELTAWPTLPNGKLDRQRLITEMKPADAS